MTKREKELLVIKESLEYYDRKIQAHLDEFGEHGNYRNHLIKMRNERRNIQELIQML